MPEREEASTLSRLSKGVSRRSFLGTTGVAAASLSVSGTAAASSCTRQDSEAPEQNYDAPETKKAATTELELETEEPESEAEEPESESVPEGDYDQVIDVVEAGADNTGGESIASLVSELADDNTLLKFPEGRYYMDELVRFTGFENFGMVGEDATIVPAPADEYKTEARMFKFGVYYNPGENLHVEGFNIDYTAPNTGLRAFDLTVTDGLYVENITFEGVHDAGTWGPMHVDIVSSDGYGVIKNVEMPEGGEYTADTPQDAMPSVKWGPTGIILSPYHSGRLDVKDCVIGAFPDNGFYQSALSPGRVVVTGGEYRNSNSANVRLTGEGSGIYNTTFIVDQNRPRDEGQRAIRFDGGDVEVVNADISLAKANGEAIAMLPSVESMTVKNTSIRVENSTTRDSNDAVSIAEGSGDVTIKGGSIVQNYYGQALQILEGDGSLTIEDLEITGDASGATGGREAIYCERGGCEFNSLVVDQPGGGNRRALGIFADDVSVVGGEYASTGQPITVDGESVLIRNVTAGSYSDDVAIKVIEGAAKIVSNVLYEGIAGDSSSIVASSNSIQ
jgi:hypothetical protein